MAPGLPPLKIEMVEGRSSSGSSRDRSTASGRSHGADLKRQSPGRNVTSIPWAFSTAAILRPGDRRDCPLDRAFCLPRVGRMPWSERVDVSSVGFAALKCGYARAAIAGGSIAHQPVAAKVAGSRTAEQKSVSERRKQGGSVTLAGSVICTGGGSCLSRKSKKNLTHHYSPGPPAPAILPVEKTVESPSAAQMAEPLEPRPLHSMPLTVTAADPATAMEVEQPDLRRLPRCHFCGCPCCEDPSILDFGGS